MPLVTTRRLRALSMATSTKRLSVLDACASPVGRFLFDTNVWLFINGPYGMTRAPQAAAYSSLYKAILSAGGVVHISDIVVSEYINRFARYEWEAHTEKKVSYKAFRRQSEYADTISTIKDTIGHVIDAGADFAHCRIDAQCTDLMFSQMQTGRMDFPDLLVARICEENDLILVTDDGDYAWHPLCRK